VAGGRQGIKFPSWRAPIRAQKGPGGATTRLPAEAERRPRRGCKDEREERRKGRRRLDASRLARRQRHLGGRKREVER